MLLFSACTAKNQVPQGMDESKLIRQAHEIIELTNSQDYEAVQLRFKDDLRAQITIQQFQTAIEPYLDNAGEFSEYKKESILTQKDSNGEEYAVVIVIAKYKNSNITYTISFDKEYNCIGFYLK